MKALLDVVTGWIGGLFGRLLGSSEDAERMRHEREMANLDALAHGRLTPAYALRYAGVIVFVLLCVLIVLDASFPGLIPGTPAEAVEAVVKVGGAVMTAIFGL